MTRDEILTKVAEALAHRTVEVRASRAHLASLEKKATGFLPENLGTKLQAWGNKLMTAPGAALTQAGQSMANHPLATTLAGAGLGAAVGGGKTLLQNAVNGEDENVLDSALAGGVLGGGVAGAGALVGHGINHISKANDMATKAMNKTTPPGSTDPKGPTVQSSITDWVTKPSISRTVALASTGGGTGAAYDLLKRRPTAIHNDIATGLHTKDLKVPVFGDKGVDAHVAKLLAKDNAMGRELIENIRRGKITSPSIGPNVNVTKLKLGGGVHDPVSLQQSLDRYLKRPAGDKVPGGALAPGKWNAMRRYKGTLTGIGGGLALDYLLRNTTGGK